MAVLLHIANNEVLCYKSCGGNSDSSLAFQLPKWETLIAPYIRKQPQGREESPDTHSIMSSRVAGNARRG